MPLSVMRVRRHAPFDGILGHLALIRVEHEQAPQG